MTAADDTRERILDAAEGLLRRYGPAKTTVSDVARSLGMSHANIYRFFASKADLQAAVARRWLVKVVEPLAAIAAEPGPAPERLRRWVRTLVALKRKKVLDDPELFANYRQLVELENAIADAHVAELHGQLARIVRDGVAQGLVASADPQATAVALLSATMRFHHPYHIQQAGGGPAEAEVEAVLDLLLAGLAP